MAKTKTIRWDILEHLKSDEDVANYLDAVFEDGTPALVAAALIDAAQAKERLKTGRDG